MARRHIRAHLAAQPLRAIDDPKLSTRRQRLPVVGEIGGDSTFVRVAGIRQIDTLHQVGRIGEDWDHRPRPAVLAVPAVQPPAWSPCRCVRMTVSTSCGEKPAAARSLISRSVRSSRPMICRCFAVSLSPTPVSTRIRPVPDSINSERVRRGCGCGRRAGSPAATARGTRPKKPPPSSRCSPSLRIWQRTPPISSVIATVPTSFPARCLHRCENLPAQFYHLCAGIMSHPSQIRRHFIARISRSGWEQIRAIRVIRGDSFRYLRLHGLPFGSSGMACPAAPSNLQ